MCFGVIAAEMSEKYQPKQQLQDDPHIFIFYIKFKFCSLLLVESNLTEKWSH